MRSETRRTQLPLRRKNNPEASSAVGGDVSFAPCVPSKFVFVTPVSLALATRRNFLSSGKKCPLYWPQDESRNFGKSSEGAADQPRRHQVRDVRGDRRGTGSGAVVFSSRRRGWHDCQNDLGLRHDRERRDLWLSRALCHASAPQQHARP